jgi:uncharacterized delta-60 repeat protein
MWRAVCVIGLIVAALACASPAVAAPWDLDPAFDFDGRVFTDFVGDDDDATGIAIQAGDGKIVVVGNDNSDLEVARYNLDGSLDSSFSGDGKQETRIDGNGVFRGSGVAIQADGKIVVAGTFDSIEPSVSHNDFAVARYNTNGTLDTSFSGDGKLTTEIGLGDDNGRAVAIQADGKIVVGGDSASDDTGGDFALARYNSNGTLDNSFSGDGKQTTDFGTGSTEGEGVSSVAIHEDKIVVAGSGTRVEFALARYNSDGALDDSFSGDGRQTTDFPERGASAAGVAFQADGKIVVAGSAAGLGTGAVFALARYITDGTLDGSFSGDGRQTADFSDSQDGGNAVAIQPDGKIVVAGHMQFTHFALARFNGDGTPDTSFSDDGKQTDDLSSDGAEARAVAVQADGRILARAAPPATRRRRSPLSRAKRARASSAGWTPELSRRASRRTRPRRSARARTPSR